jgi:RNA-binding protein
MKEQAMQLTPAQRRFLKQVSHELKPLLQMGKDGPSEAFMIQLKEQLAAHELLKIRILTNNLADPAVIERAFAANAVTIVQKVGHIYTVFKQKRKDSNFDLEP